MVVSVDIRPKMLAPSGKVEQQQTPGRVQRQTNRKEREEGKCR